jgi:hypothetical protein
VSVVVVATIIPLPEHRDAVIAAFTETIPKCIRKTAASSTPSTRTRTG